MANIGFSFNANSDYMSNAENAHFKMAREQGLITFFRTAACRVCRAEVLKGKTYCSKRCKMDTSIEAVVAKITDTDVILETKDGSRREGRLTAVTWNAFPVNDEEVRWPRGVVMNGDKNDEILWERLAWIKSA